MMYSTPSWSGLYLVVVLGPDSVSEYGTTGVKLSPGRSFVFYVDEGERESSERQRRPNDDDDGDESLMSKVDRAVYFSTAMWCFLYG